MLEQLQRCTPFLFVDHDNARVCPAERLPARDRPSIDVDYLLMTDIRERSTRMHDQRDAIQGESGGDQLLRFVAMKRTGNHTDVS